jgi:hypothetical protein
MIKNMRLIMERKGYENNSIGITLLFLLINLYTIYFLQITHMEQGQKQYVGEKDISRTENCKELYKCV